VRALVLGASGQVGSELVRLLGDDAAVMHAQVSITDANAIEDLLHRRKPDLVFNCAAYNSVDQAESEPELAMAVNGAGPALLAAACARHGAMTVHFSTNFVFDGEAGRPYVESDTPRPLSAYARSKLAGERGVIDADPRGLVLRTAAVYGYLGRSFPERILAGARQTGELKVVSDQRINPTSATDLARAALDLAIAGERGIVHAVASGCCAWDELAVAVLQECGVQARVSPIVSSERPAAAIRPRNGCLLSERVSLLRPWREALHEWARTAAPNP
jgi:dTDP-4-dehydrorhamnose reductase